VTDQEFWKRLKETLAIEDDGRVQQIGTKVLEALGCRLTFEEAENLKAQLPSGLKQIWNRCESRPKWNRAELLSMICDECDMETEEEAEHAVRSVFGILQEGISAGEADDVEAQLPKDMKSLWESARLIRSERTANTRKVVY